MQCDFSFYLNFNGLQRSIVAECRSRARRMPCAPGLPSHVHSVTEWQFLRGNLNNMNAHVDIAGLAPRRRNALGRTVLALLLLLGADHALASVMEIGGGFKITYDLELFSETPTGEDIHSVIIFEWNAIERSADYPFAINSSGPTRLEHVISFDPTHAFVIGYLDAKPGVGDEKRHLFTLIDTGFSDDLVANFLGVKFSILFGQGEQDTIDLLDIATGPDAVAAALALDQLWGFVQGAAAAAAFDPRGGFAVHHWSATTPPFGGSVPAPGAIALLTLGALVACRSRSRKTDRRV